MTAYSNTRRVINFSSQEPQNHYDLWLKKIGCGDNSRYELQIYDCDRWHTILGGEGSGSSGEYELSVIQDWMQGSGTEKYVLGHKMSIEDGDEKYVYLPFKWDSENNTLYFVDENGDPHEIGGDNGGGSDPDHSPIKARFVQGQQNYGTIKYRYTFGTQTTEYKPLTTEGVYIPINAYVELSVKSNTHYVYSIEIKDSNNGTIGQTLTYRPSGDIGEEKTYSFTITQPCTVCVVFYNTLSISYDANAVSINVSEDKQSQITTQTEYFNKTTSYKIQADLNPGYSITGYEIGGINNSWPSTGYIYQTVELGQDYCINIITESQIQQNCNVRLLTPQDGTATATYGTTIRPFNDSIIPVPQGTQFQFSGKANTGYKLKGFSYTTGTNPTDNSTWTDIDNIWTLFSGNVSIRANFVRDESQIYTISICPLYKNQNDEFVEFDGSLEGVLGSVSFYDEPKAFGAWIQKQFTSGNNFYARAIPSAEGEFVGWYEKTGNSWGTSIIFPNASISGVVTSNKSYGALFRNKTFRINLECQTLETITERKRGSVLINGQLFADIIDDDKFTSSDIPASRDWSTLNFSNPSFEDYELHEITVGVIGGGQSGYVINQDNIEQAVIPNPYYNDVKISVVFKKSQSSNTVTFTIVPNSDQSQFFTNEVLETVCSNISKMISFKRPGSAESDEVTTSAVIDGNKIVATSNGFYGCKYEISAGDGCVYGDNSIAITAIDKSNPSKASFSPTAMDPVFVDFSAQNSYEINCEMTMYTPFSTRTINASVQE